MLKDSPNVEDRAIHRIVVAPNCSLTFRGAVIFFGAVAVVPLSIAMIFVYQGFWPVLPFAGLELSVLALALGVSQRRGRYREIISITADRIVIEKGLRERKECTELPRHWARVDLRAAASGWRPSRLWVRSRGRSCELAACLSESERRGLWHRLVELIGNMNHSPAVGDQKARRLSA